MLKNNADDWDFRSERKQLEAYTAQSSPFKDVSDPILTNPVINRNSRHSLTAEITFSKNLQTTPESYLFL